MPETAAGGAALLGQDGEVAENGRAQRGRVASGPAQPGRVAGRVAGVVLAAGAGVRMGGPKALVTGPDGVAWVTRACATLLAAGCDPVLAVLGAGAQQARALVPGSARVVIAADWADGMSASLRAGLIAVQRQAPQADAALITLVDTPDIGVDVIRRLAALAAPGALARARFAGRPGHPVLLGRDHWAGVIATAEGDAGARAYLAAHDTVDVDCTDLGSGLDADTPEHVAALTYAGPVTTQTPQTAQTPQMPPATHAHGSRMHPPGRRVVLAEVSAEPLDMASHVAAVQQSGAGAVVTFAGVVRDQDEGRAVTAIEYVGHPTAEAVLRAVAAEVASRGDAEAIAVSHRIGSLGIGDAALVVAVSGVHRQEAFATAMEIVDEVKRQLPVWKRQIFPDGTDEWVACP
jgi:molybdenum cofactor cytidylyltransferase/nicotine blue oxidoreductase